ncbi:MAG: sigma-70 family RNA polymerase sigma factor [Lentisphaerales bacterium]|nr:sigma-70 family RNA polymerase sigma factor [Lentisphaerales bacterium]
MNTTYATRKSLLYKVKDQQDLKSWDEFTNLYRRYIYMVARNMNLTHHDAEDITQRALIKLWEKLPDFEYDRCRGTFRSWLCTIIRHMVINFVKRKARMLTTLDDEEKSLTQNYLNKVTVPELKMLEEREWNTFLLNSAWESIKGQLTDKVREAYLLLHKGQSLESVSEQLGIKLNTVYVYRLRVQQKLAKEITSLVNKLS